MNRLLFVLLPLLLFPIAPTAQTKFQAGHTHDILKVKFSPDGSKLVSYSWGDSWLCYWDVRSGQLLWKGKTTFIEKADERYNLEEFGWSDDFSLLYSRSENGTFQTWNIKTGRVITVSESDPRPKAPGKTEKKISVTKDHENFYLHDSVANLDITIPQFSRTGSVYDVSDDGKLFAEGGSWGNAIIRITEIGDPKHVIDLKGGKISPYVPTELETRLLAAADQRRAKLDEAKAQGDKQAAIDTEAYKEQVYIRFGHYGDMTNPLELRMLESDEPKKSKESKPAAGAAAVWLRLRNDSPLPIRIPTQSMYLPNPKCFHEFSAGNRILGLCDKREVALWFGVENQKEIPIPYGFDFGSNAVLLPKTTVLFAVPRAVLEKGNAIRFDFTFLKDDGANKIADYGTPKPLRFRESDLPLIY
jgi:hypothetical protein